MKLYGIRIHNFRSIIDADIKVEEYTLLVGPNNAGKSSILNAVRTFYDDAKWAKDDFPKVGAEDDEAWVQLSFVLSDDEWANLKDDYKVGVPEKSLTVRRYFLAKDRVKSGQSNIYAVTGEKIDENLFYGAKNVGTAKVGDVIYVPALTRPEDQTKMSGPSPLRDVLNFVLKKVVSKSPSYKSLATALEELNEEARKEAGFFSEVSTPLNNAIASWNVQIDLSVNNIEPEDISKNLVRLAFVDKSLGGDGLDLSKYGHGFQRTMIYELIKLAPSFREEKKAGKKEFDPKLTLILFEEPEAFLHPSQQDNMAYHLRRLAEGVEQQVIVTTHSAIFAGKAAQEIKQLVRVQRENGVTQTFQPNAGAVQALFEQGGALLDALNAYVADPNISQDRKARARQLIADPPAEDIAVQEESFRFQLWLDSERSSAFFADKVLLVEGATEKALFNYLLATKWHDLTKHRICIVDVFGKFNFHRFMALFDTYGIPHGVLLDDDDENEHHSAINELVARSKNSKTLADPVKFPKCCEAFLGLPISRNDRKPIEILKALTQDTIAEERMTALRSEFERALALNS